MNIGETIYKLRSEQNMSQGDLADMLDVSRQSVSKWETNQSVPDLDKIIKLSRIFGVSLDEFVLGEKKEGSANVADNQTMRGEPEEVVIIKEVAVSEASKGQKTAGVVLLCMAFVVVLALTLVNGGFLEGVILALPFLVCGFICMFAKQNAGLWCAWAVYFLFDSYTIWAIGINSWRGLIRSIMHGGYMTVGNILALVQFAVMLILIAVTVIRFKDRPISTSKGTLGLIIVGWVILLATASLEIMIMKLSYGRMIALVTKIFDWGSITLFMVVAVYTVRFIKSRKNNDIY